MVLFIAIAILIHAAYSVTEWRSLSRTSSTFSSGRESNIRIDAETDDSSSHHQHGEQTIPLDITIQTVFGFVLAMVSVIQIAGDFKEIRAGIEMGKKTWENARNRPSFYVYNHRGKVFSPHYEPPLTNQQIGFSKRPVMDIPDRYLS